MPVEVGPGAAAASVQHDGVVDLPGGGGAAPQAWGNIAVTIHSSNFFPFLISRSMKAVLTHEKEELKRDEAAEPGAPARHGGGWWDCQVRE